MANHQVTTRELAAFFNVPYGTFKRRLPGLLAAGMPQARPEFGRRKWPQDLIEQWWRVLDPEQRKLLTNAAPPTDEEVERDRREIDRHYRGDDGDEDD